MERLGNVPILRNTERVVLDTKEYNARRRQCDLDNNALECEQQMAKKGYAPKAYCQKCDGIGRYVLDVPRDHPLFGKVQQCDEPDCLKDSWEAFKRGEPQIAKKGVQQGQTFDTFLIRPGTEDVYKAAKELASGKANYIWLLIIGPCGNGKTHLANATAAMVNSRGLDARIFDCSALWGALRQKSDMTDLEGTLLAIQDHQFLVLDDFSPRTDWETEVIERILVWRYRNLLPTVLTTNKDIKQLPERIVSRFYDPDKSRCIENKGKDYRMRGA